MIDRNVLKFYIEILQFTIFFYNKIKYDLNSKLSNVKLIII